MRAGLRKRPPLPINGFWFTTPARTSALPVPISPGTAIASACRTVRGVLVSQKAIVGNVRACFRDRIMTELSVDRGASGLRRLQHRYWNARKPSMFQESSSTRKRRSSGRSPDAPRISSCYFNLKQHQTPLVLQMKHPPGGCRISQTAPVMLWVMMQIIGCSVGDGCTGQTHHRHQELHSVRSTFVGQM